MSLSGQRPFHKPTLVQEQTYVLSLTIPDLYLSAQPIITQVF